MCRETLLCTAWISPWGIVTSLFIYDSWSNIVFYATIAVFFVITQFLLPKEERRRRQIFLVIAMYLIAVIANLVWIILRPSYGTYGSSGVVYAEWGIVSGFALFNTLFRDTENKRLLLFSKNKLKRAWAGVNLVTIAGFVLYLFLDPSLFLNESPGVNVFAHAIAFLGGFFSIYCYRLFSKNVVIDGKLDIPKQV